MSNVESIQLRHMRKRLLDLPGVTYVLALLIAVFAFSSDGFLSAGNLSNIALQGSLLLMLALPMTFVILTEGLDLSVGALLGLCGVVAALTLLSGYGVVVAILAAAMVGLGMGVVNGVLVGPLKLPAFVVTLGTFGLAHGAALLLSDGASVSGFDPSISQYYRSSTLGVPTPVLIAGVSYLGFHVLLYRTRFGAYVFAIGGNKDALRLAGKRAELAHVAVYVLCSVSVALSSILLVGRMNSAHPTVALGMEFDAIAAVVLGGTAFERGRGWLFGTVLGVLTIAVLRNGLNVLAVANSLQVIAVGVMAIAALVLESRRDAP